MIRRRLTEAVTRDLARFPAVVLLGPRQCGKTTLARALVREQALAGRPAALLDLERPSDLARLRDPERFLRRHATELVCLDEVQRVPELFAVLRALIDEDRRPGRFLLLGSASPELLRQGSESLAGRVALIELAPFSWSEVTDHGVTTDMLWLRGGFPDSLLATDEESSLRWREQFIRTFLERDLPQLGFRVPAATLSRFWRMCAHLQGQVLNLSALGRAIGSSHTTVRHYLDMLEQTFVLRTLPPYETNLGKRLVKSPRLYLRDSGLLHALLDLPDHDALSGHPVFGPSWEGFVVEQLLAELAGWQGSYFRTATGDELDLVLERRGRRVAIECKASSAPTVDKGFWRALELTGIDEAYVVAPVSSGYPIGANAMVATVGEVIAALRP